MSFILDALRKSENERQRSAVPGISNVPAVVTRGKVPGWMLGLIAGLTGCVVVLAWAWIAGIGTADRAPPAAVAESRPAEPNPVSASAAGEVRSLVLEARQPDAPTGPSATPTTTAPAPENVDTASGPLPTLAELRSSGAALPELTLELHVFSAAPGERFVFINSSKYLEGESLPEGPRLVEITEDGVVLSHLNQSFLLPRE